MFDRCLRARLRATDGQIVNCSPSSSSASSSASDALHGNLVRDKECCIPRMFPSHALARDTLAVTLSVTLAFPKPAQLCACDNSYSWFRSKTFDYHIKVSDGGSPSEDANNGHTATKLTGDSETWDVLGIKEEADNIMYNLGQGLGLGK